MINSRFFKTQLINSWTRAGKLGLVICAFITGGSAAPSVKRPDFCKSLPPVIGSENHAEKSRFPLDCDTAFVRKNDTTVIRPGTLIYFSKPSLNSTIKVEGTLILQGDDKDGVSLSGSAELDKGVWKPGKKSWGGIEVAEGGRLVFEHATFHRAPTPITSFSRQVKLVKCFFEGSSGIILPNGSLLPLDPKGDTIENLAQF